MNYATQCAAATSPEPADKLLLFTVCGTACRGGTGPDGDPPARSNCTTAGSPSATGPQKPVPMWPSITEGRNELIRQINLFRGPFALAGYSQGRSWRVRWKHDILPSDGVLHH